MAAVVTFVEKVIAGDVAGGGGGEHVMIRVILDTSEETFPGITDAVNKWINQSEAEFWDR